MYPQSAGVVSFLIPWRSSPLLIVSFVPRVSSLVTTNTTATTPVPSTPLAWRPMVLVTPMVGVSPASSPILVLLLVVTMRPFVATFASVSLFFGHGGRPVVHVWPACVGCIIPPLSVVSLFNVAGSAVICRGQHGVPGRSSRVSVGSSAIMAGRARRMGAVFVVGVATTTTMATVVASL